MANKYRLKFTLSNGETIDAGEIVVPEGAPGKDGKDGKDGAAGANGADGYTPVKGVDYFTNADKAAIVQDVLAALPYYDGTVTITGGETLISFTIGSTTYQAVDGMTWGEWVESEYNTGGFYTNNGKVHSSGNNVVAEGSLGTGDAVGIGEEIIPNGAYAAFTGGSN